jgi:hypothetical protein
VEETRSTLRHRHNPQGPSVNLYFSIIESSAFEQSHPWLLENLCSFDRQAYIDALLDQHDYLPDDFRM